MSASANPETWMRRAIALSRKGYPAPNPHVGCVLVKAGTIVGEGWHDFAGGPHAEAMALEAAAGRAKGADCYVTLEPCNHQGRTGPCSEALIEAGVRRVFAACADPNLRATGGMSRLRQAGVEAETGMMASEAALANRVWLTAMRLMRPFVCVKAAVSLDGRIALPGGECRWITGDTARAAGRKLRAEMGAVLVGAGTAFADDPKLTARTRGAVNEPLRIAIDLQRRIPDSARMLTLPGRAVRIVAEGRAESERDLPVRSYKGQADLADLLRVLWDRGETSLLVEGGGKTIASFLSAGFVDRLDLFVAPIVLGGGPLWVDGCAVPSLGAAHGFPDARTRRIGRDLWIQAWREQLR